MSVLVRWGLEEIHRWKIACADCGKKVVDVVLMVRGAGVPNLRNGRRPRVGEVGRRRIVLEKCVMRDVIAGCPCKACRTPLAAGRAIAVLDCQVKATHERPPTYTGPTEQIAYILPFHTHHRAARAHVPKWIGIADDRERSGSPIDHREARSRCGNV